MVLSESNAGGTAWGLTDLNRGVGIFVGLHNVLNSLVLSHGDLTHQVRLLHLLSGKLGIVLLLLLLHLSLAVPVLGLSEGALLFTSSEDAASLLGLAVGVRVDGLLLLLRSLSTDHSHSLVLGLLLLSHLLLHLLLLELLGVLVVSTDGERRAATGRGKDAR